MMIPERATTTSLNFHVIFQRIDIRKTRTSVAIKRGKTHDETTIDRLLRSGKIPGLSAHNHHNILDNIIEMLFLNCVK